MSTLGVVRVWKLVVVPCEIDATSQATGLGVLRLLGLTSSFSGWRGRPPFQASLH